MDSEKTQNASDHGWTMLLLLVGTGLLLLSAVAAGRMPCWILLAVVAVIAWPIWRHRVEQRMRHRQLLLGAATTESSRIRRWFWRGRLLQIWLALSAFGLAFLLVILLSLTGPSPAHIGLLLSDALLVGLLLPRASRYLAAEVSRGFLGILTRGWVLASINLLLLTLGLMLLDFFVIGAPDTRMQPAREVVEQAFLQAQAAVACDLWGLAFGVFSALEAFGWHFAQQVIPQISGGALVPGILLWAVFLLRDAGLAAVFTLFVLGLCLMANRPRQSGEGVSTFTLSFYGAMILLFLIFLFAAQRIASVEFSAAAGKLGELAQDIGPCKPDDQVRARMTAEIDDRLLATSEQLRNDSDAYIEQEVERIFSRLELGVDNYLDWVYSVSGEYQRLLAAFSGDVAAKLKRQATKRLYGEVDLEHELSQLDAGLRERSAEAFSALLPEIRGRLSEQTCSLGMVDIEGFDSLSHDSLRAAVASASGAGVAAVTGKMLAKKTGTAVISKLAAKKTFKATTSFIVKALAKRGASVFATAGAATLACSPSGFFAVACGAAAGIATTLAIDKLLVKIDEAVNREQARAEMIGALRQEKQTLIAKLKQAQAARIEAVAGQVRSHTQRFLPYREGLGR